MTKKLILLLLLIFTTQIILADEPVLVTTKRMTLETALKLAQATIEACREKGVQIAVTVVDRNGDVQVVLKDTLAMDLTLEISKKKAYTALSFNTPLSEMEGRFTGAYSVPKVDSLIMSAGGLPITAQGTILGGVGVSGAPGGDIDEACAAEGLEAIMFDLEMAD